jgi:undecaprenyl diphosphate synthase
MPRKTPDLDGYIAPGSEEESIAKQIDFSRLPSHVAIIMDGNGRWAQSRRLPRVAGHRAGIEAVRDVVEASARLGLQVLTLYAFSKENWKRPRAEINTLMMLLKEYLNRELRTLVRNDIRFHVIGRMEELDPSVQRELRKGMEATRDLQGMIFNIALSYGGRAEIVDACRRLIADAQAARQKNPDQPAAVVDEAGFAKYLYTAGQPDPDLLIRTSGELRISNFLLWQIAYAEIWVTPTLWPDFRKRELLQAILDFQRRDRRYGGVRETAESGKPSAAAPPAGAPGKRRVV